MILTKEQAQAISNAMAELAKVGAILHARILPPGGMTIHVQEYLTDEVNVWFGDRPGNPVGGVERFSHPANFRKEYDL